MIISFYRLCMYVISSKRNFDDIVKVKSCRYGIHVFYRDEAISGVH